MLELAHKYKNDLQPLLILCKDFETGSLARAALDGDGLPCHFVHEKIPYRDVDKINLNFEEDTRKTGFSILISSDIDISVDGIERIIHLDIPHTKTVFSRRY